MLYNRLGTCNHITFTVKTAGDADRFGVSFVRDTDAKKYYTMMVNPEENGTARKVNFEKVLTAMASIARQTTLIR